MQQKFLEKTLGQQIADMAAKYPDDNMIDYTDRDYSRTWKEFNDECETIARGFMALGLKKGSHISIWGTNVPAWLLTFFGSAKWAVFLLPSTPAIKFSSSIISSSSPTPRRLSSLTATRARAISI